MVKVLKILIVKTSSIGDIIQSFDVLDYLQSKVNASIDWVVEKDSFLFVNAHPLVHRAICLNSKSWISRLFSKKTLISFRLFLKKLRFREYDLIFDLQGNWKSSMVLFFAKGEKKIGFGAKSVRERINLLFTDTKYNVPKNLNIRLQYVKLIQKHFSDDLVFTPKRHLFKVEKEKMLDQIIPNKSFKILICPGSRWPNKRLTDTCLLEFLKLVDKRLCPFFVFSWGTKEEKIVCLDLCSNFKNATVMQKLSLCHFQNFIAKMDLMIAMDSCALHLGAMANIPTFSFFGPTKSDVFNPSGEKHYAIQGKCPYGKVFIKQCPLLRTCKSGACLKGLKADEVYATFIKWWIKYSSKLTC